jgi:hypothetical protein
MKSWNLLFNPYLDFLPNASSEIEIVGISIPDEDRNITIGDQSK